MLVLTRKLQETIHIGDNVKITIVRIQGNTVRVGIEAPGDVRVVRGEVVTRDEAELAAAEVEVQNASPAPPAVVLRRQAPLARIATGKARLRLAMADNHPDLQAPVRESRAGAVRPSALTC